MKDLTAAYRLDSYDDAECALDRLREKPLVVKISGKVVSRQEVLDNILSQLFFLASQQVQVVLAHGAGPQLNSRLGARVLDDNGERVTPPLKC